jgi:hypothetical protein
MSIQITPIFFPDVETEALKGEVISSRSDSQKVAEGDANRGS